MPSIRKKLARITPLRLIVSCALAGTGCALLDLAAPLHLGRPPVFQGGDVPRGALYLLGVAALGGALVGLGVGLVLIGLGSFSGSRRLAWKHPSVLGATALLGLAFAWQNRFTFEGPRISEHPLRPLFMLVFFGGGILAILLLVRGIAGWCVRLSDGRARSRDLLFVLLSVGAAVAFHAVDALWHPGLYQQLHQQLAVITFAAWAVALTALIRLGGSRAAQVGAIVAGLLISTAFFLRLRDDLAPVRAAVATRAVNTSQWLAFSERPLDLLFGRPGLDVADASRILRRVARDERLARTVAGLLDERLPRRREMNLLVISIDTLRNDRMGYMGYPRRITPAVDALAARSLVFERTYTQYPTSAGSFSSFFSSRYTGCAPIFWEWRRKHHPFPEDFSLAGMLEKHGWTSGAVVAFNRSDLERRWIFGHLKDGFSIFNRDQTQVAREAPQVTRSALERLRELAGSRFFLWVHYLDPHAPYAVLPEHFFGREPQDRYDGEISRVDAQVARILRTLEEVGRADDTVVVVFSDHGEEFYEHDGRYHCTSLYEEQVRVPLVVHVPGLEPRRIEDPVGLIDVVPSLFELFGIEDPYERNGHSFWPPLLGLRPWPGFTYAELFPNHFMLAGGKDMLVLGKRKLITSLRLGTEEIYDLETDAGERRNRLGRVEDGEAALLRGLREACRDELRTMRRAALRKVDVREDTREDLEAELESLAAAAPGERSRRLQDFIVRVADPVFGIKPQYEAMFAGPLKVRLRETLVGLLDPGDPLLARGALRLINILEDPLCLPAVKRFQGRDVETITEALLARAALGDPTVLPLLRNGLKLEGVPDRGRIAVALLQLGDTSRMDLALCAATGVNAVLVRRVLEELGRLRSERLLPLAERMLTHVAWEGASVRMALERAVEALPSGPGRNRLLGRLAADYDREVARRARRALVASLPETEAASWLAAGSAEREADEALQALNFEAAKVDMERAVASLEHPPVAMLLKLSSVAFTVDDMEVARRALEHPGAVPEALRSRLRVRRDHLRPRGEWMRRPFPFVVQAADLDSRGLPGAWNVLDVTVKNTGDVLWPAYRHGWSVAFEVVVTETGGDGRQRSTTWPVSLAGTDVPPGGRKRLLLPFLDPTRPGAYEISVRMVKTLPSQDVLRGPEVPLEGRALRIVTNL